MHSDLPQIFSDNLTRRLYANDASMYEEIPSGVCFPESAEQLSALIRFAAENGVSVTARAAGTSLAGQTTGGGIIADVSRKMDRIVSIEPDQLRAVVQPGVIRDALNREAAAHGLVFGPDTSTTNRCMIGGMIGNNSAGSYSIKYGSTREHVIAIDAVLSDGSRARFEPLSPAQIQAKQKLDTLEGKIYRELIPLLKKNRKAILEAFPHPEVKRRNTGYALDMLCGMDPITPGGRPFNLAELLCGSEGTLALTSSAEVRLSPVDPYKALIIPHFYDLDEAMHATVLAVAHQPAAVELIDHHILDATRHNLEQQRNRFFLDGDPRYLLIIEFEGSDPELPSRQAALLKNELEQAGMGYSIPVFTNSDEMKRVWDLRKAGLGLLMGAGQESKTPSFAEDTAVRVADLPEYIREFRELLDNYQTSCVFYAHASVGELHLRPVFDLENKDELDRMKRMMEDVADLVKKYRGSLSGEHGDGRNRAPYIERVIGGDMTELLRQVKEIWDPEYRLNPGKIVRPLPLDSHLRHYPGQPRPTTETVFHWRKENGFASALDLCNGAGVCRKRADSGGTMCPSYMATLDEKDSTRGRANIFRQIYRENGIDAFSNDDIYEALKLCLSCKACKSECPANVDMARMKSEFMQGRHDRNGTTFATGFWANPFPWLKLGALTPAISNALTRSGPVKALMQQFAGLHPDRPLPAFAKESFSSWAKKHAVTTSQNDGPEVVLLVDLFTDLHQPEQAKAAWRLLNGLGCRLRKPISAPAGRTQISGGLPRKAVPVMENLIRKLAPLARRGVWIIGIEPSELLTLRDEYFDLCPDALLDDVKTVASKARLVEEFITEIIPPEKITTDSEKAKKTVYVHGHCYAKALTGMDSLTGALSRFGYDPVVMDTGCCGMAGSFGYRNDTFELSMKIGGQRLFPQIENLPADALICVHGFSCNHQIKDGTGRTVLHPAELMWDRMISHSRNITNE